MELREEEYVLGKASAEPNSGVGVRKENNVGRLKVRLEPVTPLKFNGELFRG